MGKLSENIAYIMTSLDDVETDLNAVARRQPCVAEDLGAAIDCIRAAMNHMTDALEAACGKEETVS